MPIAKYITIQYLRTPFIRDKVVAEERRIEEKMLRLFKTGVAIETNNTSIAELNIIPDIDEAACHATQTYLDKDYVDNIVNHLAKSYWHFYYSPQSEFYTSDNPVVIIHRGYIINMIQREFGLTDYGAEVSLNPNLLLSIYDYRYYNQYNGTDGLLKEADEEHIKSANNNQFTSAKRFVISKTGDFTDMTMD